MNKLTLLFFIILVFVFTNSKAQITMIEEGFETTDSILPPGWHKVNNAVFPISANPDVNWTVRDSGEYCPGLANALTQSHNGTKSVGVSWWASIDTSGQGGDGVADCWLITPQITGVNNNYILKFWASGGSASYSDSIQIWGSFIDSIPSNFVYLQSVFWPAGSVYGQFQEYTVDLSGLAFGTPVYIAFRYYMDCAVDGFFVFVDDVYIGDPTSINTIGSEIPERYALGQNYPNPFNPTTRIKFDIAKTSNVKLTIFNSLGQVVKVLQDGVLNAGYYEAEFDGSTLASGTYFYRLEADAYVETKKMLLVK